jgi:hypothetical protein
LPLVLNLVQQKIEALERQPGTERQPESTWDALGALVANAEHGADLKPLLDLGGRLRAADRESLAQIAGALIHTAEWPVSWVKPRGDLVRALESLAPLIDAMSPVSAVSRLGVQPSSTLALGSVVVRVVVHLLDAPCPPRELRYLAALCNLVLVPVSDMNRLDLAHLGLVAPPSVAAAREGLGIALFRYGEAARAMNHACGEALFNPLLSEP